MRKAFTIIEALAVLFVFSVVTMAFYQTWFLGTQQILNAKNRLGAIALANQKMEIIRSLPYANIGTKRPNGSGGWLYGIPAGEILEDESVVASNSTFQVHTFVQYVDDAFDGTIAGSPTDLIPTDYKRARVEVSWGGGEASQTVALFASFAPVGVEASSNAGVLSVNALDSTGTGVSGVSVHITNASSGIDLTGSTDAFGNLTLPGAPAGSQNYRIVLSKTGYYGVRTYPLYPSSSFDPVDVDASVVINAVNQKSLVIDHLSDITIHTVDSFGADIPNVDFHIKGGQRLGTDHAAPATEFFSLDEDTNTDADGMKSYAAESYGRYSLAFSAPSSYRFLKMTPEISEGNMLINAFPGQSLTFSAIFADESINSLIVTVKQLSDGSLLPGASVRLSNTGTGGAYDTTVASDSFGRAYFPTELPGLPAGEYDLEVSSSGLTTYTGTVTVSNTGLEEMEVSLSA